MSEWISVKDKLPPHKISILLYTNTGHIMNGYFDKGMLEWVSLFLNGIFELKITHWQPLPKPPIT